MIREKTKSELVQLKRICRLMGRVVGVLQGRITHGDLLVMTGSFCCIYTLTFESSNDDHWMPRKGDLSPNKMGLHEQQLAMMLQH